LETYFTSDPLALGMVRTFRD